MSSIILHHDDLDGYMAAAIALWRYPDAQVQALSYDNVEAFPTAEKLAQYDQVVVVDCTLPPEEMLALSRRQGVVWIDHHLSALRSAVANGYDNMPGLRLGMDESPRCAAELSWQFFVGEATPRLLRLVGDYDTYRNFHEPEFAAQAMPFFYGAQLIMDRLRPAAKDHPEYLLKKRELFFDEKWLEGLIADGLKIQAYNRCYYGELLRESAFVRKIRGLRLLCFNCAGHGSSNMHAAFNPELHDGMLLYSYNGSHWNYGLYTDTRLCPEVDMSAIAVEFGGGGHRGAAGFRTEKLLPELGGSAG